MESRIIGIGGVSAAGKSTLCQALANALGATVILWDDYEKLSEEPDNYLEWFQTSKDYNVWKYDALANVLKKLKNGQSIICPATGKKLDPTKYVIFEAPLALKHPQTSRYIDFLVFLDTPPDIALARRLLREFRTVKNTEDIFNELEDYLISSRPLYLWSHEANLQADLILDGSLSLKDQVNCVLDEL